MKYRQIIKTTLYLAAGILVLVFHEKIMDVVGFVVGGVILAYGVDLIGLSLIRKNFFDEDSFLFVAFTYFLLGAVLFIVSDDIVKVCLV
ncbi:MAG: hypothetical protein J6Z36_02670, partial [Clostridia bacterium]|nr:hypothetical protein [Clostridia bacterium]